MEENSIYVFGVINEIKPKETYGITNLGGENTEVYPISHKDLVALVSKVPAKIYEPGQENVLEHQKVMERIMKDKTIVPLSFGTTFKKQGDVVELLKQTSESLKKILRQIKGKIELGVKVFWDQEKMIKKASAENTDLGLSENPGYTEKIKTGKKVESALAEYRNQYIEDIHQKLKTCAEASRVNDNITDDMILNAAFLVENERESEFDEKMNELGQIYEDELDFKYSGPWPPYNFVNMKLEIK